MRKQLRKWGMLFLALFAFVVIVGPVRAQAGGLDHTEKLFTAGYKNLVNQVSYKVTSSGKIKVTMNLNTAYAGAGRTKWTMYVIYTDGTDDAKIFKQAFRDQGISTKTTQVLTKNFQQGDALLVGAYTDVTERQHWTDTSDIVELMENAFLDQAPSLPTDPKETAKTINTGDKWKTFKQTFSIDADGKAFVKINVKKATWIKWKTYNQKWKGNNVLDLNVGVQFYETSEKDPTNSGPIKEKGDENVLEPGTYWLRFDNPIGVPVDLTVQFQYRHLIPATGIEWTVDGKKVTDMAEVKGSGSTIKGTLVPKTNDSVFQEDNIGSEYEGITDVKLSKDKKSFTGKIPASYLDGLGSVKVWIFERNVSGRLTNGVISKSYELPIGRAYSGGAPYVAAGILSVYHNSLIYDPKVIDSNLKLRVRQKSGSKWVTKYDGAATKGATIKLSQNKKYTFKMDYYYEKDGKAFGRTAATTVTVRSGSSKKPVIKSATVTNVKQKKVWVDGHWVRGTVYDVWKSGHYDYSYTFKLKVTLSQAAPSGVLGLQMVNQNVVSGNATNNAKVSGDRKTFTFNCSSAGNFKTNFRFYSDAKYGGISPASNTRTIKVK